MSDDDWDEFDCPKCKGKDTLYRVSIYEYCSVEGCDYSDRVDCCEDCAGIPYDYPDDEGDDDGHSV